MDITFRSGTMDDVEACGAICYRAFAEVAETHNFRCEFANVDEAMGAMNTFFSQPESYVSVVAEAEGRVVGSNFLDVRSEIHGVGPLTIDPDSQNGGVGRALMEHVLQESAERGAPGVRLTQASYHGRTLGLYTKLGFHARQTLICMQGTIKGVEDAQRMVRAATLDDVEHCNRICMEVHGHTRDGELRDMVELGQARVVEVDGRITGYSSALAFYGHSVGSSDDDIKALLADADEFAGPGVLVPISNHSLLRWCLENGLTIVQSETLMSRGLYNEPTGSYLPSIMY